MSTVERSVKALLENKLQRVAAIDSATSKAMANAVKHALGIHNGLANVKPPIAKRANDEQRNDAWRRTETNKAFGERLREWARVAMEVESTARAHAASKPTLPAFDKTDMLAAMETIAIAQRVASSDPMKYHELSPIERIAALRVPTLAKIPPSVAERWTEEAIGNLYPERLAAYRQDLEVIEEAKTAMEMVKHSFQAEAGFIDSTTGAAGPQWGAFEREHLGPIRQELEKAEATRSKARADSAVEEARRALQKAEFEQNREEIALLKAM